MHQVWKYKLDHVAFWLITLLFYAFTRRSLVETNGWPHFIADVSIRNLLIAFACYANIYLLFDRFFRKGRYVVYAITLLGLIATYTLLQNTSDLLLNTRSDFLYISFYNFSIGIFYIFFTLALELSKRWYQQQLLLHRIQTEKLQTELQYLKAQLNPHFLFNSINSIFFLIDKENAEARESLHKFSELLRYQLYECNEDKIPIEKEIKYLESYVDLQRLRINNDSSIVFKTSDTVKGFHIAPLLLAPFVENAFKFLSDNADPENVINVNMDRQNSSFVFSISNTFDTNSEKRNPSGIGLKNVQRRLDLLYSDRYKLDIKKSESEYSVRLEIEVT